MSQTAWNAHLARAIDYGYVKAASQNAVGIVGYFYHLANPGQTWTDARPAHLIALSERLMDPAFDHERRKGAERTPTFLFDPSLPSPGLRPHHRATERTPGARHAIWWDPDETPARTQRRLQGGPEGLPVQYYADLAITWGIEDPRIKHLRLDNPVALASSALEAIGQGTLVPSLTFHNPQPPSYPHVRIHRNKELEW